MTQLIRKTFTLTEKDVEIIETIRDRCGFVSDSEIIRTVLRFYAEHSQCLKRQ
jgi:Arc/MetJ-type ribon-helix-helix transcriptional regulator